MLMLAGMVLLASCDDRSNPAHEPPTHAPHIDAGQPDYIYNGCAAQDGPLCPRSQTVFCALDLIRKDDDGVCAADEDCTLVELKHDCVGLCGPLAVADENREEIQERLQGELSRYCTLGTCQEAGCDAGTTTWVPVCHISFCERMPADAGAPDASAAQGGDW